ncbi:MAG: tetratricopeptide repeat protein, partial [Muribaculaceae bacterium]|nr:tetratricopeptide repeat protein [Muribaculaceae bacterium]
RITYKIRRYYDVEEIRRVLRTNPRNLSLNELFLLANSCEPGSAEYDEAFEMAARLFPDNLTANLNAANSAMNRGNYAEAERYLGRAGDSPEAEYARGILALKTGDLDKAEELLRNARRAGIPEAQGALDEISRLRNFKGAVRIL